MKLVTWLAASVHSDLFQSSEVWANLMFSNSALKQLENRFPTFPTKIKITTSQLLNPKPSKPLISFAFEQIFYDHKWWLFSLNLSNFLVSTTEAVVVNYDRKVVFCKIYLLITKHNITDNVYIRLRMYNILHRIINLHIKSNM